MLAGVVAEADDGGELRFERGLELGGGDVVVALLVSAISSCNEMPALTTVVAWVCLS